VRRCRGYYRLGVLAEPGRRDQVLAGLEDRSYTARRIAMLALGSFPSTLTVERMLDRAVVEAPLRRDFLASVDRLGHSAVPVLRGQLQAAVDQARTDPESVSRRGQLAAEALGLVGAIEAVPALEAALVDAPVEMQVACINALGSLGSPTSVAALAGVAVHESPEVRRVAAQALGLVGGWAAVEPLARALEDDTTEVARAAANALWRCGPRGAAVLRDSATPVSREVLALVALGKP
jgi:HEAT repeat protein